MSLRLVSLLALVPGLIGYLVNGLLSWALSGPARIFAAAFYLQAPLTAVFCLWLGHRCARSRHAFPAALAASQWANALSFLLYLWQFHLCDDAGRSFFWALLAQCPAGPLLFWAMRIVMPFSGGTRAQPETTIATALSLVFLAILFSLGFW
ncbi:hypothetical protein [uncultured Oscillibacter sp.]|uniref:hypothetical protein n=1 Tax=uncultured Oscillibacter sp. TaxID=876091 RepID=UPI00280AE8E1|nr:hypothetical protein [uncultured Oscillibacter sp.]